MSEFVLAGECLLVIEQADITRLEVDAIVNAANERMLGGGGVDGAIHRAAGPELRAACEQVSETRPGVRCPTGEARLTPGFRLPARFVVHTVGPVYSSRESSSPLLRAAYRSSLRLAREKRARSIAFPAISCGVFGYPLDEAAPLSIETCREHCEGFDRVVFALFGEATYSAWESAAERLLSSR